MTQDDKKSKRSKAEIYIEMTGILLTQYMEHFGKELLIYQHPESGRFSYIEVTGDMIARLIEEEELAQNIVGLGPRLGVLKEHKDRMLSYGQARECVLGIPGIAKIYYPYIIIQEMPKDVTFKSSTELTFCRLDYDPQTGDQLVFEMMAPEWDKIKARMGNFDAFAMWIWSLFVEKSDRSQYIWLRGEGNDGKSVIGDVICEAMGSAYTTATPDMMHSKFWAADLVGKRFCFVTEAEGAFPKSEKFKGLSGDSRIQAERKGKDSYKAVISTKFLFVSNQVLELDDSKANFRRAIVCEIQPFEGEEIPTEQYKSMLMKEMPFLLGYGRALYEKLVKNKIPCDTTEAELLVNDSIQSALNHFEFFFKKDAEGICTAAEVNQSFRRASIFGTQVQHKYKRIWREHLGVCETQKKINGNNARLYYGMRCKNMQDENLN